MNSDLKTATLQLKNFLGSANERTLGGSEKGREVIPFETLNVMVGEITFGGRITDRWDKRTNASILRLFFTEGILDDEYKFSRDSDVYFAPPECDLATVRS